MKISLSSVVLIVAPIAVIFQDAMPLVWAGRLVFAAWTWNAAATHQLPVYHVSNKADNLFTTVFRSDVIFFILCIDHRWLLWTQMWERWMFCRQLSMSDLLYRRKLCDSLQRRSSMRCNYLGFDSIPVSRCGVLQDCQGGHEPWLSFVCCRGYSPSFIICLGLLFCYYLSAFSLIKIKIAFKHMQKLTWPCIDSGWANIHLITRALILRVMGVAQNLQGR